MTTEWAASTVFTSTMDDSLRFCLYYQKVNAVSNCDSYHLRRMYGCFDSFGEVAVLSTVDVNSWYLQIKIDERKRENTVFASHHSLYWFMRMSFGPKNAPETFQRAMDGILASVQ